MAQQTAQTTPPPSGTEQPAQLQEVEVTGTRIKQTTDFTTPTPTTVIDTQTMESLGVVNVGQVLSLTPANVSEFSPTAAPSSPFYTGAYVPDLRGLNGFFNSRTLTLIDGQRAPPTNTSDSFDLNFIPQVLVQRIDTVTGGASAAYGSGAVAGVVNIILNRQLEGGKLDADMYDTHYNDARDKHASFAYGHGLFNDRFHFVIGGEYEKQDPASCMQSGRPWCTANFGPYTSSYYLTPAFSYTALQTLGSNVRTDVVSTSGTLAAAQYDAPTFGYTATSAGVYGPSTEPLYEATADGQALLPYSGNEAVYGGDGAAPGGQGNPENLYTNLVAPVTRGVITALLTTKITDSINMDIDLNWGQVNAKVPNPGLNESIGVLGLDNPFLPTDTAADIGAAPDGYYLGKDWNEQIPNEEFSNTTMKRVLIDFNGPFGDSSWTWDGYWEYGLVENTEGEPTDFHADAASMALDSVETANGPECRITQALNDNPGNLNGAFEQLLTEVQGTYAGINPFTFEPEYTGGAYPGGTFSFPSYMESVGLSGAFAPIPGGGYSPTGQLIPADPLTGLSLLQQEALLAQNCVPLNPFGTTPLSTSAIDYATGDLSLNLRQTQSVIALNATGNIWRGIGAGPWSMAAGYEWRQEVVHNTFATCPPSEAVSDESAYELCLAQTTDFTVQFGDPYAGDMDVNEAYLEFNLPLLRNQPLARLLSLDIAGRESQYKNTALYAIDIPGGSSATNTFPTWKASLQYEPLDGIRFRATQSRDERAPDPRDLYYSQIFVAGSLFGSCGAFTNPFLSTPCNINLIGNVNLKPEAANTTTFGIVLTPPQAPGLEFSADWFHIHLTNGIEGGNYAVNETECATGHGAAACPGFLFNPFSYEVGSGSPCAAGVSGALYPGSTGVDCTGVATLTGAAAYQQGNVANILGINAAAYNGSFYDTRGVDFSLNYVWALPDGSTLAARALATWTDEQVYQLYAGAPILSLAGQTGGNSSFFGLGDYQNAPHWQGNVSVTWAKGPWSITPNMRWVGQGSLDNQGLACSKSDLTNPANPCDWVYNGFAATGLTTAQTAAEAYARAEALTLLPMGVPNSMPSYFLFGLNVTYSFNVLKGLQVFGQVSNLFNKSPPLSLSGGGFNGTAYTSNPVFFDMLGQAYRVGFRLSF